MTEKYLTDATARKLQKCSDQMDEYVHTGYPPNAALEKVAMDNNLLPGHIRLLAQAYNSGLSNYNLHEVHDIERLHGSVLADADTVIKELYPSVSKKAEAEPEWVSLWYMKPLAEHCKEAFDDDASLIDPTVVPEEPQRCQASLERELRALYEEMLLKKASLETNLLQLESIIENELEELEAYFKRADAIHPQEVSDNCYVVNKKMASIVDHISYPKGRSYRTFIPVDWQSPPYSIIDDIYNNVLRLAEVKEAYDSVAQEVDAVNEKFASLGKSAQGRGSQKKEDEGALRQFFRETEPLYRGAKEVAHGLVQSVPQVASTASTLQKAVRTVTDTDITPRKSPEKLLSSPDVFGANAATVKVLLADLMLNDPIISNYPPEEVYKSFAKLLQLAPGIATRSEPLRLSLRKLLTMKELEPIDIEQLTRLDQSLRGSSSILLR